MRRFSFTVLL
ncbi:MAG: hypothetical protein K0S88_5893, partial [Actinomycetia bacterium]|nr:hypothetical protein [Actinomycetes bacterium]